MRLIDAEALDDEMYRKSFEVDDGRNVWNSGLWIRYKIYEEASKDAPTVDAVPVNWIEDYLEKIHDDLDYARQDNDEEAMKRIFWKYETIRWMVADWRHDEKTR